MTKKIAIAVVAVAAGLAILGLTSVGRKACSFARLGWNKVEQGMEEAVPPEVEIARLRDELNRTGPTIKKTLGKMAEDTVAIQNLEADIKDHHAKLDQQRKAIGVMRTQLAEAKDAKVVFINDQEFPRTRVEDKLVRDFEVFKRSEAALKQKEDLLDKKKQGLEAAREQLKAMESMKAQLEIELAGLEAEVKAMRVAEARSREQIDDSKLGEVKAGVSKLRDRVRKAQVEGELVKQYTSDPGIEVEKKVKKDDVLKEIDAYFAKPKDGKAIVEK